jgi:DNA-binding MarR family transcriptional regulator
LPRRPASVLQIPLSAIVRVRDDFTLIVRFSDDLVPFSDDVARIVPRPDVGCGGTLLHMGSPPDDSQEQARMRMEVLRSACQHSLERADRPPTVRPHGAPFEQRRSAERELIDEILTAARCIAGARDWSGQPVHRTDGVWRVLDTVAHSRYCLAIADLARSLRVRKQTAHALAHAAARARVIELVPNHQDKRILQLEVTPCGRAELAAARIGEHVWLATLLSGLGDHEMAATINIIRVIRQRLERDAKVMATKGDSP